MWSRSAPSLLPTAHPRSPHPGCSKCRLQGLPAPPRLSGGRLRAAWWAGAPARGPWVVGDDGPSHPKQGAASEGAWGLGTGQEHRPESLFCRHSRAGQVTAALTAAPQAWPPVHGLESQPCRVWAPLPHTGSLPALFLVASRTPAAGPTARAGAADTTSQRKLSARSQGRGAGCRGRQEAGGEGDLCLEKGSRLQQPDHQHQGPCVLPQTHTHRDTQSIPPIYITPQSSPGVTIQRQRKQAL